MALFRCVALFAALAFLPATLAETPLYGEAEVRCRMTIAPYGGKSVYPCGTVRFLPLEDFETVRFATMVKREIDNFLKAVRNNDCDTIADLYDLFKIRGCCVPIFEDEISEAELAKIVLESWQINNGVEMLRSLVGCAVEVCTSVQFRTL